MIARPRRWRLTAPLRTLVRETELTPGDLVAPLFVSERITSPQPIGSMPGVRQWPIAGVADEARALAALGIRSVLLFGIPAHKDAGGSGAWPADGVVQRAVREIKNAVPGMVVITDVCLCEYTDHGHCGLINGLAGPADPRLPEGYVLNDRTLEVLGRTALSHAKAGADVVAPSGMLDGMVAAIRRDLDAEGFDALPILSYSVKYASGFYGPFRDAATWLAG
jgi:porphobilinogen synthase